MFNISLLLSAAVIIICVLANKLSNKIGMPVLIAFIALGMVFGSDGILKIPLKITALQNDLFCCACVFIMFYGGFGTKLLRLNLWSKGTVVIERGSYFHGGSYNSVLFCFKNKIARKYAYRCGYEFY